MGSKSEVVVDVVRARTFINRFYPTTISMDQKGLCLLREGQTIAAVLFEQYNGTNIWMHVAAEPGRHWLNREFLFWGFHYPFHQLGVSRISGWVEADNLDAQRFNEHIGFEKEAVLRGAGSQGQDVFIYVLRKEVCRYGQEG